MNKGTDLSVEYKDLIERRNLKFYSEKELESFGNTRLFISSFPRAGSNLLKNVLEDLLGHFIGDDMLPKSSKGVQWLVDQGQYIGDYRGVKIVKSHVPMYFFKPVRVDEPLQISRVIVLYRKFFPAMISLVQLWITKAHNKKLTMEDLVKYQKEIRKGAMDCFKEYQEFFDYWVQNPQIPTLLSDYESFLKEPSETVKKMLDFFGISREELTNPKLLEKDETVLSNCVYSKGTPKKEFNYKEIFGEDLFEEITRKNDEIDQRLFGESKTGMRIFMPKETREKYLMVLPKSSDFPERTDGYYQLRAKLYFDSESGSESMI